MPSAEDAKEDELLPPEMRATFQGYRRASGKTGTRNYIGILTSRELLGLRRALRGARRSSAPASSREYPEHRRRRAIVHGTGCGHAAYGEGFDILRRTQWGYASHPNFAGVLMVGPRLRGVPDRAHEEGIRADRDAIPSARMTIQETGGTKKTVAGGRRRRSRTCCRSRRRRQRETRPASELVLALQCGGSDGYSGITANPALGAAVRPAGAPRRHRRSCPRRRRSTAPSTCSPAAPRPREVGEKLVDAHQVVGGLHAPATAAR